MKKLICALLVLTMLLTFVGCTSQETAAPETTQEETTQETTEQGETGEKTKIVVYSSTFSSAPERMQLLLDAFAQTEAAETIELEFYEIIGGTPQEVNDKRNIAIMGGEQIDVFDANLAEYFTYADKGVFEPLDSYIEEDGFDVDAFGESTVEMSRVDGNLYALPYQQSVWMLFYNKDLFDAANVPYPTADMTWDEFRQTAMDLTSGEGENKVWGYTAPDWPVVWAGMATQGGATFMKEDGVTPNLDDPRFEEALQLRYDTTMVDMSAPSLAENKLTQAHYAKAFSAGNIAMLIAGDWTHGTIRDNLNNEFPFEYDVVSLPVPEGVDPGTSYGASRYQGINAKADEATKDAAWEVLKFFGSEEMALTMIDVSALPAVYYESAVEKYSTTIPEFVTNENWIFEPRTHTEEKAYHVASGVIDRVMTEEMELALTGEKTVEQAMIDMQARAIEEVNTVLEN